MAKAVAKKSSRKIECLNPNTGARLNIDADTWQLFHSAITHTLKGAKKMTYTEITDGIKKYLKDKKIAFDKSVGWYAVTVKNDMEARGMIEVLTEKGKKLNYLKKTKPAGDGRLQKNL